MARSPAELRRSLAFEMGRITTLRDKHTARLGTDDRRVLEEIILAAIGRDPQVRRLLSVGCHEFSSWYPNLFRFSGLCFETVDPDPGAAIYGAPKRHRVDTLQNLGANPDLMGALDLILVNGVFAYGIDSSDEKRAAIDAIHRLLKIDGTVIVGYRDREPEPDVDLEWFDSAGFTATPIPGLDTTRYKTTHGNGHAYACFRKRA